VSDGSGGPGGRGGCGGNGCGEGGEEGNDPFFNENDPGEDGPSGAGCPGTDWVQVGTTVKVWLDVLEQWIELGE